MAEIHPRRLFAGSCFGVGASAMTFVAISAVMGPLKEHFVLTNEQVGWIGGAAMWGFMWREFSRLRLQIERQLGLEEGQNHERRITALERAVEAIHARPS